MALRLLMPNGFMPVFDHGRPAIVACPDSGVAAAPMSHHHPAAPGTHQPCPYAAAAGLAGIESASVAALPVLAPAGILLASRNRPFILAATRRSRPPPTGPPLPA